VKYKKPKWMSDSDWEDAAPHFFENPEYNKRYFYDSRDCLQCLQCLKRNMGDSWNDRFCESYCVAYPIEGRRRKPEDVRSGKAYCVFCEYEPDEEFYGNPNNLVTWEVLRRKICMICPDISDEELDSVYDRIVKMFNKQEDIALVKSQHKAYEDARKKWFERYAKDHLRRIYEKVGMDNIDELVENAYNYYSQQPDYGMEIEFEGDEEADYNAGLKAGDVDAKDYLKWLLEKEAKEYKGK